jgi:hypothetical protein
MEKVTIKSAIINVLSVANKPLSPKEIYDEITEQKLFHFKAKNPVGIVNSELRKSCVGIDLKKSKPIKEFELRTDGKFVLRN